MAKGRITLDDIAARLANQPSDRYFGEGQHELPSRASQASGISAGFLAIVGGLCISVFAASYFLLGSNASLPDLPFVGDTSFVSIADPICKAKWTLNARNDAALECYLVYKPNRLCSRQERRHLAGVLSSYRSQRRMAEMRLAQSATKLAWDMRRHLSESLSRSDSYGDSDDEARKLLSGPINRLAARVRQDGDRANHVKRAIKSNGTLGMLEGMMGEDGRLVSLIERLGDDGYMGKFDFGWWPDDLVSRGFRNVQARTPNCQS